MSPRPPDAADEIVLTPFAPALLESMRAIGYSFESAVADILDNSISAGAQNILIDFSPLGDPYVAIFDDGRGMDEPELNEAMRHGCTHPSQQRAEHDLGRFGLGLKTASLSQCRQLTVMSRSCDRIHLRQWDLDLIDERKDWILRCPRLDEFPDIDLVRRLHESPNGTLVLWRKLDRLTAGKSSTESALGEKADLCRDHLSLVFHRLVGTTGEGLRILLNGNPIKPEDPFFTKHKHTRTLPREAFECNGERIEVVPYILPHPSKLKRRSQQEGSALKRGQGLYIYRNRRLIVWGTWFRMTPQEELTKLARVQVDIPNSLDHLWTLDIKKSSAYPPDIVRSVVKRVIGRITDTSRRTFTWRGRRTDSEIEYAWVRLETRDGYSYTINRDHPTIKSLNNRLRPDESVHLNDLLDLLEHNFPAQALYADMAANHLPTAAKTAQGDTEHLLSQARRTLTGLGGATSEMGSFFIENLERFEPFSNFSSSVSFLKQELRNEP